MLTDLDVDISNLDISNMPSNYLILFQNLKKIIKNLQTQIEKLKTENSLLKEESSKFFIEKSNLKFKITNLKKKEKLFETMKEDYNKKKIECENLIKKYDEEISKYLTDIRNKDNMYEHDIIQTQLQDENIKQKLENFSNITMLNDMYYHKNLDLLKKIVDIKKEDKMKLEKMEMKYTNKFDDFKKKVIKFLRAQHLNPERELPQKNLNYKLNLIHIQELVNEIEIQETEFLKLVKERDELKQQIASLKIDVKTYKNVAAVLSQNNSNLKNTFKKVGTKKEYDYTEPLVNSVDSKNNNRIGVNEHSFNSTAKNFFKKDRFLSLINKDKIKNFKNNNYFLLKSSKFINNSKEKNKPNFNIKLEKDKKISFLFKEKEKYKDLYEFYYEKYNMLTKQYSNILKAYNEQLEKIYNEEISSTNPLILDLNMETFKQFSFEKMSPEQKYAILIKLINNIAPLVCKKDLENAEKIFNIKEKYYFKNSKILNKLSRNIGKQGYSAYINTNKNSFIEDSSRTAFTCGNSREKVIGNVSMNFFEEIKKMAICKKGNKNRNKSVIKLSINPNNCSEFYPNHKFLD